MTMGNQNVRHRMIVLSIVALMGAGTPSGAVGQTCPHGFGMQDLAKLAQRNQAAGTEAEALHPAIAGLTGNVAKSYACKAVINFYVSKLGLPDDAVQAERGPAQDALVLEFRIKAHAQQSVCGSLRYPVPLGLPGHDAETLGARWLHKAVRLFSSGGASEAENAKYKHVVKSIHEAFNAAEGQISTAISNMIQPYLPSGKDLPRSRDEYVRSAVRAFQTDIAAHFSGKFEKSAGRADELARFVSVSACSPLLPVATGPNERLLAQYPSAFADYMRFKAEFDAGWTR